MTEAMNASDVGASGAHAIWRAMIAARRTPPPRRDRSNLEGLRMGVDARHREWEYKIVSFILGRDLEDSSAKMLNMHGQDGWELIAVSANEHYHYAFLKRLR